jgi:hypothetical protein
MPQYLLSLHHVEGRGAELSPEDMQQMHKDVNALNEELQTQGAWVFGGALQTPDTATVVRERDGEILTTDGPFPEAKEQIAGFYVIEAPALDAALGWAAKTTMAVRRPIEVRPFQEEPPA